MDILSRMRSYNRKKGAVRKDNRARVNYHKRVEKQSIREAKKDHKDAMKRQKNYRDIEKQKLKGLHAKQENAAAKVGRKNLWSKKTKADIYARHDSRLRKGQRAQKTRYDLAYARRIARAKDVREQKVKRSKRAAKTRNWKPRRR